MKSKLTVSVDEDLIPAAKEYARKRGVSVSSLVEQALREATCESEQPLPEKTADGERKQTFAERWRGQFKLDPEDYPKDDPRFEYLARKYLT